MSWSDPWLLLALPALAVVAALRWWWGRRLVRAAAPVGAGHPAHAASVAPRLALIRQVLLWSGLLLGVVALIGPRWGGEDRQRSGGGADVLVVFDCSRSMLADDLSPTRLEAARRKCIDLLRIAPHLRLGLMPFAATAILRCPPTGDQQILAELLRDCSPDLFPADQGLQGTSIGVAVQEALGVLGRSHTVGQAVLVVSDGADPDTKAIETAAAAAKNAGVPVFGLFIGDTERTVDLVIDGTKRTMKTDTTTLEKMSVATGALWVGATLDDQDVKTLAAGIDQVAGGHEWEERRRTVAAERYRLPLLPAILLLTVGMLLPTRRRQ